MSTSRPPIGGPSLADTLPNINFGFDELRDRMAKFTAKFDAFIEQGRKRVLEERNQFHMNVAELQGTTPFPSRFLFSNHRSNSQLPQRTSA
jgi:kinetochore protein Spc25